MFISFYRSKRLQLFTSVACCRRRRCQKRNVLNTWPMATMATMASPHCRGLRTNPLVVSTASSGGWLSRGEKKIYAHTPPCLTPHLGATLKDGKDVYICTEYFGGWKWTHHFLLLCHVPARSFHSMEEQRRAIWQSGHPVVWFRWLCRPAVTNSNCRHKKLQVATSPQPVCPATTSDLAPAARKH